MRFERNSHFEDQISCNQYPAIHIVRQRKHTACPLAVSVVCTVCVLPNIVARSRNNCCSETQLCIFFFGFPCYLVDVTFSEKIIEDLTC